MTSNQNATPIIQNFSAYEDFPFVALNEQVLAELNKACKDVTHQLKFSSLFSALECLLQLTERTLQPGDLETSTFTEICELLIGAFASDVFYEVSNSRHRDIAIQINELARSVEGPTFKTGLPGFHVSVVRPTPYVSQCQSRFLTIPLNKDAEWLWRAWSSRNKSNRLTQFPLYRAYSRFGRDFTQRLHDLCDQYYSARKCQRIIAIADLVDLLSVYPDLSEVTLTSREVMTEFWYDLLVHYVKRGHEAGCAVNYLIKNWNNEFALFARDFLIRSGLFAAPFGAFPGAVDGARNPGKRTNIVKGEDGTQIRTKLLTHVPLQVTDTEAMEFLFRQIQADVDIAMGWARWAAKDMWQRYTEAKEAAKSGTVRMLSKISYLANGSTELLAPSNPDYLKNISATFEHHGYQTVNDIPVQSLYKGNLSQVAYDLGIPTTGSLLPHCTILVGSHPIITPSFLEGLELYDEHGSRVGLIESDDGTHLIGYKERNGPSKSRQDVLLTVETLEIVKQIIALTEPVRKYLKDRNDDSWRRLLLVTGKAFASPTPINRIATDTSLKSRQKSLCESLSNTCSLNWNERWNFVRRFSLPSLRASAGVLVYLQTKDTGAMAEALGHTENRADLLSRYLPESILDFLKERWIRIFQAGVIAEALKDSPHRLACLGFSSAEELTTFLDNHALRKLAPSDKLASEVTARARKKEATPREVLIGVDTEILQILIELDVAVSEADRAPSGVATYWSTIGKAVCEFIDSQQCARADLKEFLAAARRRPRQFNFDSVLYV